MNNITQTIVKLGVVAAIYVALSVMIQPLSYGQIQMRLGEALMVLPFINRKYTISLTLGCFIVNLFSPLGLVDVAFGTCATLCACLLIGLCRNIFLVLIPAALVNGIIVGVELNLVFQLPLFFTMFTVGVGELVAVFIGVIIFYYLIKNDHPLIKLLDI
ncbi:MAG: QueT transporter family protein [Bacilli bacterium]|jgi:uncharacterized membrane protein|nr:QueT transporter family protein [Bacilli bacterium]